MTRAVHFEGSYLGADDRIGPRAVMECKICWTPYDPAVGDDFRQVLPGTPFRALPADWTCPNCDAPKAQFMVLDDPDADTMREAAATAARVADLVADFEEVRITSMRDLPFLNAALHVEACGFEPRDGRTVGVLVTPWFMNLVLLPPAGEDWSGLVPGAKETVAFASGEYEFIHNVRPLCGGYKACSLFSPMAEFSSQLQAMDVARAVLAALHDADVREETDRAADIRAAREAELAAAEGEDELAETTGGAAGSEAPAPSRRTLITAGRSDLGER